MFLDKTYFLITVSGTLSLLLCGIGERVSEEDALFSISLCKLQYLEDFHVLTSSLEENKERFALK